MREKTVHFEARIDKEQYDAAVTEEQVHAVLVLPLAQDAPGVKKEGQDNPVVDESHARVQEGIARGNHVTIEGEGGVPVRKIERDELEKSPHRKGTEDDEQRTRLGRQVECQEEQGGQDPQARKQRQTQGIKQVEHGPVQLEVKIGEEHGEDDRAHAHKRPAVLHQFLDVIAAVEGRAAAGGRMLDQSHGAGERGHRHAE